MMASDLAALVLAIAMALAVPVSSRAEDQSASPFVEKWGAPRRPNALQIGSVRIDLETGAVRLPEGMSIDQASRDFWHAVIQVFPQACRPISTEGKTHD